VLTAILKECAKEFGKELSMAIWTGNWKAS
jgi:hypothetical protein